MPASPPDAALSGIDQNARHISFDGGSIIRRFTYWWWVVPRVQYDFADLDYQLYTFEVFHQDWRSKLAHYVTIPAIAFFCMAFLAQFHVEGLPLVNGALAYVAVLSAFHFGWCRKVGQTTLWTITVGLMISMYLLATAWYDWAAVDGPWYASTAMYANPLIGIYLFSFIETASHMFEPVPPCASGTDRFMPLDEFNAKGGPWPALSFIGVPTFYTIVSFVSNAHLLPTFVLRILASAGHQRAYVRRIEALALEQWATSQPVIHHTPEMRGE